MAGVSRGKNVATIETVFRAAGRICRSCDDGPGIIRERVSGTFRYRDPAGRVVRDRVTLDRIRVLAIPPA
jgi:DNA topoisomerase-1